MITLYFHSTFYFTASTYEQLKVNCTQRQKKQPVAVIGSDVPVFTVGN